MTGLAVTERTKNGDGPSTDFIQSQQTLKKDFEKEKKRLEERIERHRRELSDPNRKRTSTGNHSADSATKSESGLCEMSRVDQIALDAINLSLEKIEDGTYGICQRCGEEISQARLDAVPSACCCIMCQTAIEKGEDLNLD